jgi:serpin B
MTSAGAKGKTLEEMQKVLHLPANPHSSFRDLLANLNGTTRCKNPGYELAVANALWAMRGYPWRTEFLDLTRKNYGAGVVETDFNAPEAARAQINAWVEKETHEKIKDLIPEGAIDPDTRMVLTNAIYFKGDWASKFDEKLTRNAPFTCGDGTKAEVPLMAQTGEFRYCELTANLERHPNRVQVLEMPYAGKELAMRIYLPANPAEIERLPQWIADGERGVESLASQQVQVSLPRFKAESEFSLSQTLIDLGMIAAFGNADFTGMHSGLERLFISAVLHKAFVEVNEKGTEAAAATGVIIRAVSARIPPIPVFRADRPFLFTIRDNRTGSILFMGRYNGPG